MRNVLNRAAMLAKGKRNLSALKRARANPTTSPAGKATIAQAIIQQQTLNVKLQAALGIPPIALDIGPKA